MKDVEFLGKSLSIRHSTSNSEDFHTVQGESLSENTADENSRRDRELSLRMQREKERSHLGPMCKVIRPFPRGPPKILLKCVETAESRVARCRVSCAARPGLTGTRSPGASLCIGRAYRVAPSVCAAAASVCCRAIVTPSRSGAPSPLLVSVRASVSASVRVSVNVSVSVR